MHGHPLASQNPTGDDYVPLDINAWDYSPSTTALLKRRLDDEGDLAPLSLDPLGREAQACYLFSQALELKGQSIDTMHIRTVTANLQAFLKHLMDPASGTWGTFCGATSMTIR
jgi:hypothetical protein